MAAEQLLEKLIGTSAWAVDVRRRLPQIARHRYHVAVTGAEGTGKQFLARMVHALSPRCQQAMVPVDCTMLGESTFASQLFGHEAGALPAAKGAGLGCFRAADRGTLYLGQVESLTLDQQRRLLQVLQTRKVTPLGAQKAVEVDVRVITASTHDLQKQVQERHLLPELYTVLDAVSLHTVPLARRREDIAPLAGQFLVEVAEDFEESPKTLAPEAVERLSHYSWPGNLSELREVIERAAIFWDGEVLTAHAFDFMSHEE